MTDIKRIKQLIEVMNDHGVRRLKVKDEKGEIELELGGAVAHHAPPPAVSKAEAATPPPVADGTVVTSPMVGSFYESPSPDSAPFVKVGDSVDASTVVCIVEAMKVMNEVKAGTKGVIKEILVENGQPIEFGTPLFRIG